METSLWLCCGKIVNIIQQNLTAFVFKPSWPQLALHSWLLQFFFFNFILLFSNKTFSFWSSQRHSSTWCAGFYILSLKIWNPGGGKHNSSAITRDTGSYFWVYLIVPLHYPRWTEWVQWRDSRWSFNAPGRCSRLTNCFTEPGRQTESEIWNVINDFILQSNETFLIRSSVFLCKREKHCEQLGVMVTLASPWLRDFGLLVPLRLLCVYVLICKRVKEAVCVCVCFRGSQMAAGWLSSMY